MSSADTYTEASAKEYDDIVAKDFADKNYMKLSFSQYLGLVVAAKPDGDVALVDIGSGPANAFEFLAVQEAGKEVMKRALVVAVDTSHQMLQRARNRLDGLKKNGAIGSYQIVEGELSALVRAPPTAPIHGLTCTFVIHFIPTQGLGAFLTQVAQLVTKGAIVFLAWWDGEEGSLMEGPPGAEWYYHAHSTVVSMCNDVGLNHLAEHDMEELYEEFQMQMRFSFFSKTA